MFSEEKKLLLEMTEEITLIHKDGLSDRLYEKAIEMFGEERTAQIIMTVITINSTANQLGYCSKRRRSGSNSTSTLRHRGRLE